MGLLEGQVAFITGAARGQGRSHAVTLAREGADIVALDYCAQIASNPFPLASPEDLVETERLVRETGRRCLAITADVRSGEDMESAARQALETFGRVDVVLANAGIMPIKPTWEFTQDEFRDTLDVNVTGVWQTCRVLIPSMIERRSGAIVMTGSTCAFKGFPNLGSYVASKHAVTGLMRTLAVELAPHRIRVNSVNPTVVKTKMVLNDVLKGLFAGGGPALSDEDYLAMQARPNLLPVVLDAEDISNAILFLVSDAARYITGVALPVDAGFLEKWAVSYDSEGDQPDDAERQLMRNR
jgi:SDR family mycofactocin-dependent oxidoreductase